MYFHLINIKFVDSFTLEIFLRVPNKANQLLLYSDMQSEKFRFWSWTGNPLICFRYIDGLTYFFKDSNYFLFNDTSQEVGPGFPRLIASTWSGVPDDPDTVFSNENGYTYFFKENLFYRFNSTAGQVDAGFPKSIALWRGILYQP